MPEAARDIRRAKACAASSPIRTSPTRGFISTVWRRSAMPTTSAESRRPPAAPRPRGILRCACHIEDVIRVAQAKIDPARMARIASANGDQAGRAVRGSRSSSSPASRSFARCCRLGLERAFWPTPSVIRLFGRVALGHGDQHSLGVRLSALLSARQAARVTARNLSLSRGAARDRGAGSADRRRPRRCRRNSRSRSPSAPASSRAMVTPISAARQLSPDRAGGDPPGAGGRDAAAPGGRRDRQRAHRGAA